MRNIRQNLMLAFVYNVDRHPDRGWRALSRCSACCSVQSLRRLAMSLSSVSVIGNALRLRAARL